MAELAGAGTTLAGAGLVGFAGADVMLEGD